MQTTPTPQQAAYCRKWERGTTTTYGYDNGGRQTSTNYSDTTPDVAISYDSLNRPITQSNGIAASSFAYDPDNLALDTETISYDLNSDYVEKPGFLTIG